jgi:hypothetical protein
MFGVITFSPHELPVIVNILRWTDTLTKIEHPTANFTYFAPFRHSDQLCWTVNGSRAVLVFFFSLFYPRLCCKFMGACWKKVVVHGGKSNYPIFWPIYLSMHVPKLDHGWLIMLQRCWLFHKQNTTLLCTWHVCTKVGHIIRTKRKGYIRTKQGLTFFFSYFFVTTSHFNN